MVREAFVLRRAFLAVAGLIAMLAITVGTPTGADAAIPGLIRLTVAKSGSGGGKVISDPAGVACGADCVQRYSAGTRVTLTARPAADSRFAGWSVSACGSALRCVVTLRADRIITATFARLPREMLWVDTTGTGTGVVTSNPSGIACGSDCSNSYTRGRSVTLTAAAAAGSVFSGWTGACTGTTSTCTVVMTTTRSVTATFTVSSPRLTVTKSGAGLGRVTSSPAGINCGTDCVSRFSGGTPVTLTARPSTGYVFAGWSGACTGLRRTCTVRLDAGSSANALFIEAAVGASDSAGNLTLRIAGRDLRLAFVDGMTGSPTAGLAVGFALLDTGVGVLLVGDPQDRFPMKIAILHGPMSDTTPAPPAPEGRVARPAIDPDDPAPLVIKGVQFQASAIEAFVVPGQLPPPLRAFVKWSGVLGAVVNVAKLIDQAGLVPLGHDFARMGIADRKPVTKEDAIDDIVTEFGVGTLQTVVVLGISAFGTAGLTLPLVAPGQVLGIIALHTATVVDLHTVVNCDNDTLSVVDTGVVKFYACDRSPGRREWPQDLLRVTVRDPGGDAVTGGGSLHLISKDSLGEGFAAILDSGGRAEIAVPIGNYTMSIAAAGSVVHTANVSVSSQGTHVNVEVEPYEPPAKHCNVCYAEYEENSAQCDPFGPASEFAECVNSALATLNMCLETCTYFP